MIEVISGDGDWVAIDFTNASTEILSILSSGVRVIDRQRKRIIECHPMDIHT